MFLLDKELENPGARSCGQATFVKARRLLRSYDKFLLLIFCTGLQRHRTRRARPGVLSWRAAHNPAEGLAEGTLGLIAERLRDGGEAFRGIIQAVGSQKHAPAGEIRHEGGADDLAKPQGEDGARHADAFGQRLQRPGISWVVVHAGDGDAHMLVRQRRFHSLAADVREEQPELSAVERDHVVIVAADALGGAAGGRVLH
jgi:hypothetical protein